jgi:hypothetical protein
MVGYCGLARLRIWMADTGSGPIVAVAEGRNVSRFRTQADYRDRDRPRDIVLGRVHSREFAPKNLTLSRPADLFKLRAGEEHHRSIGHFVSRVSPKAVLAKGWNENRRKPVVPLNYAQTDQIAGPTKLLQVIERKIL